MVICWSLRLHYVLLRLAAPLLFPLDNNDDVLLK
jgi:hypothetical protein